MESRAAAMAAVDRALILAAHARVSVPTARKALAGGIEAVKHKRVRHGLLAAAKRLGITLGPAPEKGDTGT